MVLQISLDNSKRTVEAYAWDCRGGQILITTLNFPMECRFIFDQQHER